MTHIREGARQPDRRVARTRKAIMTAFDEICADESFGKLTVSAIARQANIDRKTFYLHFRSIDDLVNFKVQEILAQIVSKIRQEAQEHTHSEYARIALREMNGILSSNLTLYSNFATRTSTDRVVARLEHVAGNVFDSLDYHPAFPDDSQLLLEVRFLAAGIVYLYLSWLKSDKQQPIETVSDAIDEAIGAILQEQPII